MPTVRATVLACLVVSTVLAGCGGVSPGDATEEGPSSGTVTPAPIPTDRPTLPPGVGRDGSVDPVVLVSTHTDRFLGANSHTLYRNETTYWPDGSVRSGTNLTVESNESTGRWSYRERSPVPEPATGGEPPEVARGIWAERERAYLRERFEDGTLRVRGLDGQTFDSLRRFGLSLDADLLALFGALDVRLATEVRTDGDRRYRLVGGNVTDADRMNRAVPGRNVTDVSLLADVGADGAVRRYRLAHTATRPNDGVIRTVSVVRYERVGTTTPDRPDWIPTEGNATDA